MTIEMLASVLAPSFSSIPIMCNNFVIAWEEVLAGNVPHQQFLRYNWTRSLEQKTFYAWKDRSLVASRMAAAVSMCAGPWAVAERVTLCVKAME